MKPPEPRPDVEGMQRRDFLRQMVRSTALALGVGAVGLALLDRRGPQGGTPAAESAVLSDYAVPGQAGKLALSHGAERSRSIELAVKALGGMAAFVRPGERVLIKVNAAFASPPVLGATSHPEAVAQVIRMCREAGAAEVLVSDNPINDPAACFELSGIGPAARAAGARVVLPKADGFAPYTLAGGRLIRQWPILYEPLRRTDRVIGLAPVKDHHRSGASLTIKNWYGLLGGRRNIFHQDIHTIIMELAMLIKPTLVILDGTQSMLRNGPTGGSLADLAQTHTVIAGTDPVAVDAFGATLLGKSFEDLPHLAMAQEKGLGLVDYRRLNPIVVPGT
jgi:uncharacterized protein (DUF362 family)